MKSIIDGKKNEFGIRWIKVWSEALAQSLQKKSKHCWNATDLVKNGSQRRLKATNWFENGVSWLGLEEDWNLIKFDFEN